LCNQSNPTITNCIIAGNNGAGVELQATGSERIVKYNYPIITNCTIVGNIQQGILGDMPTITNSIIYYNGNNCDNVQIKSYSATVTYSDIQGGWSGIGNIDTDPCFISLGYWASTNDPNISVDPNDANAIWIEGDYHLKSQGWRWDTQREVWTWDSVTSLCIDAGNPGTELLDEPLSLPIDPNNEWGQNIRIDMGAYGGTNQASMPPRDWALLGDLNNDGIVNFQDYGSQLVKPSKPIEDQPGDLNKNDIVDLADIAILAEGWLNQTSWH
jgi:parallel beta-helix repeat protein